MLVVDEQCLPAVDRDENSDEEDARLNKEEEDAVTEQRHNDYWGDLADAVPDEEGGSSEEEEPEVPVVRQSKSDKLKEVAASLEHKLSHLPKNPFCQSCIMGKMKDKYSHRRTFARELESWGEVVTCDHVYSASASALGLDGET